LFRISETRHSWIKNILCLEATSTLGTIKAGFACSKILFSAKGVVVAAAHEPQRPRGKDFVRKASGINVTKTLFSLIDALTTVLSRVNLK
jgi:hypothetical protein